MRRWSGLSSGFERPRDRPREQYGSSNLSLRRTAVKESDSGALGLPSAVGRLSRVSDGEAIRVFRVTVRGQFSELTEQSRAFLARSQPDHDIFLSAYTPEGTFTYDAAIAFFNLRYELRASGPDAADLVELEALDEAERFLATMGFTSKNLRANVVDMSMFANATRRLR